MSKDLEESLLESAVETSRDLLKSLALDTDNYIHAYYGKIAPLIIQCDRFRGWFSLIIINYHKMRKYRKNFLEFAHGLARGFIAARSEAQNLESSLKEAWSRLNRNREYKAGRSKSFEMVSPGEFKSRVTGSESQGGVDFIAVILQLVCVSGCKFIIYIF